MGKISKWFSAGRKPKGDPALRMNYWDAKWDLQVDCCPCDVHFNDWVADQGLTDKLIYHFGSGTHHVVGVEQATNGSGNAVFCITASIGEYESYIDLVAQRAALARDYLCYFGDIYLSQAALLPQFDVVTLFHLCEFFSPTTTGRSTAAWTTGACSTCSPRRPDPAAICCSTRAPTPSIRRPRSSPPGRRNARSSGWASSRPSWCSGRPDKRNPAAPRGTAGLKLSQAGA